MTPVTLADLERDVIRAEIACDIAYETNDAAVIQKLDALGLDLVRYYFDALTGANAFLARGKHRAILAVRGTEMDFADIATDMEFTLTDYQPNGVGRMRGRVHRGFYRAFLAIRREVIEDIKALRAEGVEAEGVGHSLGGRVVSHFRDAGIIKYVTTFGAPRGGDKDFAAYCRSLPGRHRRYVRGADIVPLLPLLSMGARHDVPPLYLDTMGGLFPDASITREACGRARALMTLDWLAKGMPFPVPRRAFTDHRGGGYIADIGFQANTMRFRQALRTAA